LEKLNDGEDRHRAWQNIKENIIFSAKGCLGLHVLKQEKPWFYVECLDFIRSNKQAKMQWVQDPRQIHVDNLNNVLVRSEASRNIKDLYSFFFQYCSGHKS
jgi:hypothetical protein